MTAAALFSAWRLQASMWTLRPDEVAVAVEVWLGELLRLPPRERVRLAWLLIHPTQQGGTDRRKGTSPRWH